MEDIVRDVLRILPLACRLVPHSIQTLYPPSSDEGGERHSRRAEEAPKMENTMNHKIENKTQKHGTRDVIDQVRKEETRYVSKSEFQKRREMHMEESKFERSPRVTIEEVLFGPTFDRTLLVDVRSTDLFLERHLLGSINVPIGVERVSACKNVSSQKTQMRREYVFVLADDVTSASAFAASLVEHGIPFVAVVGEPAESLFEASDSSIVVLSKKRSRR